MGGGAEEGLGGGAEEGVGGSRAEEGVGGGRGSAGEGKTSERGGGARDIRNRELRWSRYDKLSLRVRLHRSHYPHQPLSLE